MTQTDATNATHEPFMTWRQMFEFLTEEIGVPISKQTLRKLDMLSRGPPVAGYWGKRKLYRRGPSRAWAEALITERSARIHPIERRKSDAVSVSP
jgi:hypothetical protein